MAFRVAARYTTQENKPVRHSLNNNEIAIPCGTLVIMSGLPGAGKSHLLKNAVGLVPEDRISMDALRLQLLGGLADLHGGRRQLAVRQDSNEAVFAICKSMVRERLRHGLTVVFDATNLNDIDRKGWVELADETGAPHLVVIVDTPLEQCIANMAGRDDWVHEKIIRDMNQPLANEPPAHITEAAKKSGKAVQITLPTGFERASRFNHVVVSSNAKLGFVNRELGSTKCDVIGDVHGLYDELLVLLAKAGWELVDGHLRHPDPERKLLFLGDLVDRGLKTLEVLELVKTAVDDGIAVCLLGNHEQKLLNFLAQARGDGVAVWGSYANAETGCMMLKLPAEQCQRLESFMRQMPAFVVHEDSKTAFVHGDMHRFDPMLSLKGDIVYGQGGWSRVDSDALYEERYAAGLNQYVLIRGHIPSTSEQEHVFSLERHAFQQGELMLLSFDAYLKGISQGMTPREAFKANLVTHACDFDFDAYSGQRFKLARAMESLVTRGLATRYFDDSKMLRGYKYAREVFWNHSWSSDPWLMKARGVVMDASGTIVSHPFDKVFNYTEEGAGVDLPEEAAIIEVEKLNGFLGICSRNPFTGELLLHTQGGFGGKFVDYIRGAMTPEQLGRTKGYLARSDVTLMFEVLHKDDPHIIEYATEELGLYLIGVRGKALEDQAWTEDKVDDAAAQMSYRRPKWQRTTKGQLLAKARRDGDGLVKHEGWMARLDTPAQPFLFKLKTPWYLVSKFLSRLSAGKWKHMYQNPEDFKRKGLDEEFFPVVDSLVKNRRVEDILAMDEAERLLTVRQLVIELID